MLFENPKEKTISPYNIGLSLNQFDKGKISKFFNDVLVRFTSDLNTDISYLEELEFNLTFTDVEFNKAIPDDNDLSFINKYFYPIVFSEIKKTSTHKIDFKTRYTFTLDSSLTRYTSKSGIKYGELILGKKPVLFYIHIDIQKLIDLIKS